MGALGFCVGFRHVRTVLGLAEVLVVCAVVDLAIHPDLACGGASCCRGGCGRGWLGGGSGGRCGSRWCGLCRGSGAWCRCRRGGRLLCKRRHGKNGTSGQQDQSFFQDGHLEGHTKTRAWCCQRPRQVRVDWGTPAAVVDEMFFTIGEGCQWLSKGKLTLVN